MAVSEGQGSCACYLVVGTFLENHLISWALSVYLKWAGNVWAVVFLLLKIISRSSSVVASAFFQNEEWGINAHFSIRRVMCDPIQSDL